ncbi:DUF2332 domain-containing protein [Rummeliibacillus sp. NPDC094406]|uniref:DUF2332 domain-containing protein n=1 Tax=Rummeliibacillus sp. NPDC094406 TaxID=3364511 RepID=UPI0038275C11
MVRNLSETFRRFAKNECENSSELYESLSYQIAEDVDLIQLASFIPEGQPVPNLFFAATQYLLIDSQDYLKNFYASFTENLFSINGVFPYFKNFVLANQEELKQLFRTKLVQTNEVRRCAYLYPMFADIYEKHQMPLALIEIGTSAGLQLGVEQYHYLYNNEIQAGNQQSLLTINSQNRGKALPASITRNPVVQTRIGMDLNPIDLKNTNDLKWLQALIWPEHHERRNLFNKAATIIKNLDIHFIRGDAVEQIQSICEQIPQNQLIVVFHTHVANQIPPAAKVELIEKLKGISTKRPLYHCYNNMYDTNLHQDYIVANKIHSERVLGKTDGHARWFTWV